ncbi:glucose dehydrogenase [FAD, quinone] [Anoplophora glabripennis]|uniref:glucose dehydrogenase [FAD, quinone] n=1 Tax=Anoplophora glabripennis TaxID=217634 RepID=UPI000873BC03|nr:glucose dehydrogenase [FAD, quinone] [Anoplophora glabripennis]
MPCYQPFLWVFALISTVTCSPFQLTEKYIEEFQEGIAGLKKLSQEYEYHPEDFNLAAHDATDPEEFDFVIVGSGTSGAVIANRLSQIPEWKVLLLESGAPETKITQIPALHRALQTTPYNWWFTTVPQNKSCLGAEDNRCSIPEGRALGGTTAINDMLYTRGNHKDYDIWADLGVDGWCWEDVLPYFKKIEDAHIHELDRKYHSLGGPLHLENFQHSSDLAHHVLQAGHEIGINTVDYNGKEQLGLGEPQVIGKNGKRNSVAQAYLVPAHARDNLVVRPLSHVVEIIISPHTKEAQGVKYLHDGKIFVAKAAKEVVLAAGPINTPQLLLLSGVGPKEDLEHLEIQPVADLKVGHGLKDHLAFIGLNFVFNETNDQLHKDYDAVVDYLKNGKGPLTSLGLEAIGFVKTEASKEKTDYPDVEFLITTDIYNKGHEHLRDLRIKKEIYDAVWAPLEGKKGFTIAVVLLHPKSTGVLALHDKDPLHRPLINPNYLNDEDDHDLETIVAGIHKALKLAHADALQKLGIHLNVNKVPGCEHFEAEDDYWRCAIRHLTVSLGHVSGTARMGSEKDKTAVVDKKLRVYGLHKLRVADSSVIPVSISGHLTAPIVLIGEKAAELIRED